MCYTHKALSIHSYNLITAFQSSVSCRGTSREDSFDVDWKVAMRTPMTTHDTETKALWAAF